jgi:hypothetical protein
MNSLIDSIEWLVNKTKKQASQVNNPEHTEIRLQTLEQVKSLLQWQSLNSSEKQANRICLLAKHKKENWTTSKIEIKIEIYNAIKITTPYIIALNNSKRLDNLLLFCSSILTSIDMTKGDSFEVFTIEDVKNSFRDFLEIKKEDRNTLFEDCYIKIEILYQKLISIASPI